MIFQKKHLAAKGLALLLGLCMGTSLVCATDFTPAESYEIGERSFSFGEINLSPVSHTGGEVDTVRYAGIEGADYTDEKVYTDREYMTATTNLDWNPHTWETNEDNSILSMQTIGFYTFLLNADRTGYCVFPEMAADFPVDVTSEYVGSLGVEEGDEGKAWRIPLNPDATWANGEPITADDYIYSMQEQLNPKMLNRRADSYYAGDLTVYNAKNYLYGGKTTYDLITDSAEALMEAGEEIYLDMDFWGITGALDADGNEAPRYVSIADDTMYRDAAIEDETADEAWVSAKYLFDSYLAAGAPYEDYQSQYLCTADIAPETSWEDVGLKKVDDYTIDLILAQSMEEASFYLPYHLSGTWLVYKPLYEECKSFFDAEGNTVATEEEAATVSTDYGKSLEKSMAYGPYKMSYFEMDKQITFDRNENWYGYKDGRHLGMYQTDINSISVIPEHATALLAFLNGDLDSVSLQAEDMEKYASSEYISYTPQTYTTKVTFNTDYEKLLSHGTGSQVLVIDEFRKAFAMALDRQHFATAFTSAGTAGFGLFNNSYIYDPFTGASYRESEPAKKALADIYGLTYGEGGEYATLDEAYDALTGYDMAQAQELMQIAYDKAVDSGIYDGESPITIDFRVYQSDTIYVQMFTYLDTQLQEACKGSGFEGKVSMTMTVDPDYYETNYSGNADAIFSTWGGAPMNPFTIMAGCYTDASDGSGNQMEYGYDTSAIALTFTVDGEDVTASLQDWSKWANKETVAGLTDRFGAFSDYSYETRCAITAGMEEAFLNWYTCTPIYYRNVGSLVGQKVEQGSKEFVNDLVVHGGIEFLTYNYDDEEWAKYVADGPLNY